ncbi:MAG: type II CAAX endopeptidase family protein [Archangium sp.]|nr:type II CAAX endopeptidase family protein [Archangium sp.]
MSLLRDAEGRVRAPYVVGVFTLVAVVTEGVSTFLLGVLGFLGFGNLDSPRVIFSTAPTLAAGVAATLVAWLIFREPTGLAEPQFLRRLGQGFAVGAVALTVACVVPALAGATSLTLTSRSAGAVAGIGVLQLITLAPAAIGEELLIRGLGFQALRRGMGDAAAVVFSGLVFGGLHLFNPGATWLASLEVALVGFWFGALTVRTGSVWLAMGLHSAWNFFEGFVFGQPVSGTAPGTSIFVGHAPAEPGFWSGGAFGPEAAGWTAVVLVAGLAVTLLWPRSPPAGRSLDAARDERPPLT